jgi:hypothetical protein
LGLVHFLKRDALSRKAVLVCPTTPLIVIDGKFSLGPLFSSQLRKKGLRSFSHGGGFDSGRPNFEEAFLNFAIGRDPFEGFGDGFFFHLGKTASASSALCF